MAIEKITKFSDAIQPTDIINEVVETINNADLEEFVGASESQAGKQGIVPAPEAGSEDRYLNADGTWKEVKQNLTIYTSLEQIGITPGEETFTSIHNALKVNEQIIYWFDHNVHSNYNVDFYPTNYGLFSAIKLSNGISQYQYIEYQYVNQSKNIGTVWETYYNTTYPDGICEWNRHIDSQTTNAQVLSGPLNINKPSNYANIVFYTVDGNVRSIETDENMIRLEARTTTETTDRRMLSLYSASNNSLVDALRILDQVNNSINYYRIYGTHNLATQAEAEAGTDNNKPMSPLRVKQAIAANNAKTATTLQTARTIRTNLASTSTASFNGSANITPGVTGVLPIANGGTGNSSGIAPTATKATQDSAGQQINTTYIKGLSASGSTITYTKGNGTTGSITVNAGGLSNNITVTKSTQGNWSPPDETFWYWNTGDAKHVNRMSIVTGLAAGTYTLQNLLQQLVNKSHTHSTRNITINCDCDCDCD